MLKNDAGITSAHTKRRSSLRFGTIEVRPLTMGDAPAIARAVNFRSVTQMTASLPYPYQLRHARAWVRDCQRQYRRGGTTERHYAITVDGWLVGAIGVTRHGDEAHLGYWLTPTMWGRGIMTKVVRRFVPQVWRWWPVVRLVGKVFPHNLASARVLEKSGFRRSALELRTVRRGRRWMDTVVFTRFR